MKILILLKIIFFFQLIGYCSINDNIKLKISSGNNVFENCDSIVINFEIENESEKAINIYCWKKEDITKGINKLIYFYIKPTNDTSFKYSYIGPEVKIPHKDDYITIASQKSYSTKIILNKFYIPYGRKNSTERSWPPGKYEIYCVYSYNNDEDYKYGNQLWEGQITSNKITIEIK